MKRMLVLPFLAIACVAGAQTPPPLTLTLDDALRRGLETSHRLAETAARGEAADAVVSERRAARLPQLAGQAGYMRTNHVDPFGLLLPDKSLRVIYPDIPDNYRARLDLQWPIYTGGRLDALERAAAAEAASSADDLMAARADLGLEITRAYWALVTATQTVRVVDTSVNRVDAHLQDVRNQLAAGLVPPNDVLTAVAQLARQRMLAIQARTSREVAEAELARLIGTDAETPIQPTATLDLPDLRQTPLADLVASARMRRPERAALLKRVAAAEERQQAAAAGRKPTVSVGGGVDYARPNPRIFPREEAWRDSWDAGVNLTWPLFDGGRSRAELAEARAMSRAAEARVAEFDAQLAMEIRQRMSEIGASRAAVEAADEMIRSATEAQRVVSNRFAAGVATSLDVLDAQVLLLQADLDRTQTIAGARLADARLARLVGR